MCVCVCVCVCVYTCTHIHKITAFVHPSKVYIVIFKLTSFAWHLVEIEEMVILSLSLSFSLSLSLSLLFVFIYIYIYIVFITISLLHLSLNDNNLLRSPGLLYVFSPILQSCGLDGFDSFAAFPIPSIFFHTFRYCFKRTMNSFTVYIIFHGFLAKAKYKFIFRFHYFHINPTGMAKFTRLIIIIIMIIIIIIITNDRTKGITSQRRNRQTIYI